MLPFIIEMRLTLHSPSGGVFPAIAEKVGRIPLDVLNKDPRLLENSIEVTHIETGCLIVDVLVTNSDGEISLKMICLVKCLMEYCGAFHLLLDNNISEMKISGYYYQPWNYVDKKGI